MGYLRIEYAVPHAHVVMLSILEHNAQHIEFLEQGLGVDLLGRAHNIGDPPA
jgi:hypothetical protein